MDYVRADEVADYLKIRAGKVLGVVAFGAEMRQLALQPAPLWVDIPVLGGYDTSFEIWSSADPVTPCSHGDVSGAEDGRVLFGSLQLEQAPGGTLETLAERVYTGIFNFTELRGYPHLLRVWHYFPQINDPEHGLERYRCFNVGRHEAFLASGRGIGEESVPAASALGCNSGPLVVYFLAGKLPGKAVENPRQVSAYRYPELFGPRSPAFVRAMLATFGRQQSFFISGTASIVGYETLHQGDVQKQTEETLRNIRTLMQQLPPHTGKGRMLLKAYIRYATDLPQIRKQVENEFGTDCKAVYLQSNICRSDLLLEIEGAHFSDLQP